MTAGPGVGSRRALLGILDQIVSSGTNYATAVVASLVLRPEDFGSFVVDFAIVTVLAAASRAFLSEPLIAHLPGVVDPDRRRALARSAIGAAVVVGLGGTVLVAGLGLVAGSGAGGGTVGALTTFAPWVLGALVADAGRYVLLARRETGRTLVVDLTWAAAQGTALVGVAVAGEWTPGAVAATWGVGALAAVAALGVVGVEAPAGPVAWLREGRDLSGCFTVVSVLGQVQAYAVLLLAGAALMAQDMAGLRAVQLLVFQPPTTLMGALMVLATPVFAGLVARGDLTGLVRARRRAMAAMAALGLVVLAAIPLRDVLLGVLFPRYTDFAPLVAPIAAQAALLGLAVPFASSLRAMRRGRALLALQVFTTTTMLTGAGVGLLAGGVVGLAWGLAGAAALAVGTEVVVAVRARPAASPDPGRRAAVVGGGPR